MNCNLLCVRTIFFIFFALFVLLLSCCDFIFFFHIFSFIASILCAYTGCWAARRATRVTMNAVRIQWIINYVFKILHVPHLYLSFSLTFCLLHVLDFGFCTCNGPCFHAPCCSGSPPLNGRFAHRHTPHALNTHPNTMTMTTIANNGYGERKKKHTLKWNPQRLQTLSRD